MPCSPKLRSCVDALLAKGYPEERAWAICKSQLGEAMHSDFLRILNLFTKRYGEETGTRKFDVFIQKNRLNTEKAYDPDEQFKESFEWIEPLIRPYKEDSEAKYYLVTALTADISMNNVDYGPEDRLAREDSSMNWRPVNINHDHSKWLPYPRTRVDFSAANEFSLEATLRVDNRDRWLQQKLDKGQITHPSIEGRPHPISGRYHFTGLALLEKGVELPGSPLSDIVPLVFNESVGKSICEFKAGKMVCECKSETTKREVKPSLKRTIIKEAIREVLLEQVRSDAERAKAHFNISDEEWNKLSDEEKQAYIAKLPPRGTAGQEAFGDASFPDSCFAYVPDSAKGADGNKSDRKLPYKNADGTISMDHVRNALARLDQTEGIPAEEKERIRNMLQNILQRENPEYEPEGEKKLREQEGEEPVIETPEQSEPEAETQPPLPHECPAGYHWSDADEQCMLDEVGDSAEGPLTKLPGPEPALVEQEVPDATNAPSTVAKDDTAECPEGQHWDPDLDRCVDDVMEECEAGWHFDTALQKCIPDNVQVNESKYRLKIADYELENIKLRELVTELREEILALKTQRKRKNAENTITVEKLTRNNYTKDGVISEQSRRIDSLEAKDKRNAHQITDLAKREQMALKEREDAIKSRDSYKQMYKSEHESREKTMKENEGLTKENLGLTNELTEAKAREVQWTKDKKALQEGLNKALKHQKYVYEFLKNKGFEIVAAT